MTHRADPADIRAVIFDFDGTLAVQTLDFGHMRDRAMEALSRFAPVKSAPTESAMEELDRFCAALDPDTTARARQAALQAIENVELEAARRSSVFPPVRPMLASLRERNIPCAIITRNIIKAMRIVFPDLEEYFACILTRDDVANVKPHSEHLQKALEALGCTPERALMVGDHPMDIQVGKKVGTMTAGVGCGHVSLEVLARENPNWLADDVGQLMCEIGLMD